jgi:dTDP-L-rhamnose 4-epimerase
VSESIGAVLVTGGAGFIGSSLAARLAGSAESWTILDNLHPQVHPGGKPPADLDPRARLVVGDVTDPHAWDDVLATVVPDTIVHLAAETGTAQSLHEATRHAQANVVGTTVMLDALGRAGQLPRHFVLSSSRAVYGEGQWRRPSGDLFSPGQRSHAQFEASQWDFPDAVPVPSTAAATPPAPTSVYGATKLAQEHILRAWTSSHDSRLSVLRLQNVYGPGQSLINPYTGIVSLFSQLAKRGEAIPIYEDGRIVRDFVFIDDVRDAFVDVIENGPRDAANAYDVGSGIGTTILELASKIAEYHGAPAPRVTGAYRDGDVRHAECSIDATLEALTWSPQFGIERGIAELQVWIDEQKARA